MLRKLEDKKKRIAQVKGVSSVTWAGFWVNAALGAFKILIGFLSNSRALVADGVHSLSDMASDVGILVGVRYWSAPPDAKFPYGRYRLESMISLSIGVILAFAGAGVIWDAAAMLFEPRSGQAGNIWALMLCLVSMALKEWLYRWTMRRGIELNSAAVQANAKDHRSDAISSIPTALGIAVSLWFPSLSHIDLIAALIVGLFILYSAWEICLPATLTLLDRGADKALVEKIKKISLRVNGVKGIHDLRTRYMGMALQVDMHVAVADSMTVTEANRIAHELEDLLCSDEAAGEIGVTIYDVLVHVDPWVARAEVR